MKAIEVSCSTEQEAFEIVCRNLRMPKEVFELVDSFPLEKDNKQPSESDKIAFRFHIKMTCFKNFIRDRLLKILKGMSIAGEVKVGGAEDFIRVEIYSRQGSLLIGRRGETLDAIQHLLNRMICRNDRDLPMILVDVENYRARAHQRLKKLAERTADSVKKTRQPIKLQPMSSSERKFIHKLLGERRGITTYSIGREGQRCVVIAAEVSKSPVGEDEELLPELMNDPVLYKRNRPLFEKQKIQDLTSKKLKNSDSMNDLMDSDMPKDSLSGDKAE